ncbi:polysaccharide deacetylase family protein [Paenibacillus filicis]|uniref:Polysaccharide deacetylase family protein n=1 Tax=Paenibacillus filicis TaxID=669464 RepID=A0ABU9DTR9_9BACL
MPRALKRWACIVAGCLLLTACTSLPAPSGAPLPASPDAAAAPLEERLSRSQAVPDERQAGSALEQPSAHQPAPPTGESKGRSSSASESLTLIGPPLPAGGGAKSLQTPETAQLPLSPEPPSAPVPEPEASVSKISASKGIKQAAQKSSKSQGLTLSQLARKYPEFLLLHGRSSNRQIALTFDDAPDATYTPQILDVLKAHKIRATFFLIGSQAEKHPAIVKRIVQEGHVIGNHSYSHPLFTKLSQDSFQQQITRSESILNPLIGYTPKLIRPPYGEISESQLLWASEHGYLVVNWNVDSLDWKQLSEAQVMRNILDHAKAGSIVLQHSGGGHSQNLSGTVQALPKVIEKLQGQGYRIVTLPELLRVTKGKK